MVVKDADGWPLRRPHTHHRGIILVHHKHPETMFVPKAVKKFIICDETLQDYSDRMLLSWFESPRRGRRENTWAEQVRSDFAYSMSSSLGATTGKEKSGGGGYLHTITESQPPYWSSFSDSGLEILSPPRSSSLPSRPSRRGPPTDCDFIRYSSTSHDETVDLKDI